MIKGLERFLRLEWLSLNKGWLRSYMIEIYKIMHVLKKVGKKILSPP